MRSSSDPLRRLDQAELELFSTSQLFEIYVGVLRELTSRGVVRTANAPAGDYADHLVASVLGGELAPNSEKSWDVQLPDGQRLQVKCRVVRDPPTRSQLQLSPFRSFEFDDLVIVLLSDADYSVRRVIQVPVDVVRTVAVYRQHVNGHILFATEEVTNHSRTRDITALFRPGVGAP